MSVLTTEIAFTLVVLVVTISLFVWDKLGVDLVAMICLLALTLPGILTPSEALAGFSSSAVITIAAIFVVSSALLRTGAADRMGDLFLKLGGGNPLRLLIVIMLGVAIISAFMYNAPATAVLMPAVIVTARRSKIAPSKLLIPLSYGSVLGGTMTLIGSTPNLVISQSLESHGLPQFHIFDPLVMGMIFTISGITFMALVGRHLLPNRDSIQENGKDRSPEELVSLYCLAERWHRLRVQVGSRLVGQTLHDACLGCDYGIAVLALERAGQTQRPVNPDAPLQAGDVLFLQGHDHDMEALSADWDLDYLRDEPPDWSPSELVLAEVTLAPRSELQGRTIGEIDFRNQYGCEVLGIWRGDRAHRSHLADFRLQMGDALLLRGSCQQLEKLNRNPDFLILTGIPTAIKNPTKAILSLVILGGCLAPVLFGVLPLSIASVLAAVLIVLTGCLQPSEVYRDINWKVIVMLGGTIALGAAMQKTGAALYIAQNLIEPIAVLGDMPLVAILFAVSTLLSVTTSNLAAGVLMSPLALNVALSLGYSPYALLMVVMMGVSAAFVTPFSHQGTLDRHGAGQLSLQRLCQSRVSANNRRVHRHVAHAAGRLAPALACRVLRQGSIDRGNKNGLPKVIRNFGSPCVLFPADAIRGFR